MEVREQITERTEQARRQANAQARCYWLAVVLYLTICLLPAPAFSLETGLGLPAKQGMTVADGEYLPPSIDLPVALTVKSFRQSDIPQPSQCMFRPFSPACKRLRWRLQEARGPPASPSGVIGPSTAAGQAQAQAHVLPASHIFHPVNAPDFTKG